MWFLWQQLGFAQHLPDKEFQLQRWIVCVVPATQYREVNWFHEVKTALFPVIQANDVCKVRCLLY